MSNLVAATSPVFGSFLRWLAIIAASVSVSLHVGCATSQPGHNVQFISFEEPQQEWPTQKLGLMHPVDGFPIYGLNQLPPEPYQIRGFIYVTGAIPAPELESVLVQRARAHGGEGAILTKNHAVAQTSGPTAEYLVIEFKTNALATVRDRIKVYLALHPEATNRDDQEVGSVTDNWEGLLKRTMPQSQLPQSEPSGRSLLPILAP